MKNKSSRRRGFTLTELLVTISIIGILAALLLPTLAGAKRRAARVKCVSNLKQIGSAFIGYTTDNRGRLPWQLGQQQALSQLGGANATHLNVFCSILELKDGIGAPEILFSPCDQERAKLLDEAKANWTKYNPKTPIPSEAISYVFIEGADAARPTTMLAATRNLSSCDMSNNRWVGVEENPAQANAISMLYKNEGHSVLMDGSASQSNDGDLGVDGKIIRDHIKSSGGISKGPASTFVFGLPGCQPNTAPIPPPGPDPPPKKNNSSFKYLTLQAIQAGSTVLIDNLTVTDLDSNKVVYKNNFNSGSHDGLTLKHTNSADSSKNRIEKGKLRLECHGFQRNGAGDYNSAARVNLDQELPGNFKVSFMVRKLQWPGHFHFIIGPSKNCGPAWEKGSKFAIAAVDGYTMRAAAIDGERIFTKRGWSSDANKFVSMTWVKQGKTLEFFFAGKSLAKHTVAFD